MTYQKTLIMMQLEDKQAQIEQRIKEIEYMLQNAEIISEEQMV